MLGLSKLFNSNEKELDLLKKTVEEINSLWVDLETLSNEELREKADALRNSVHSGDKSLDSILPEAFALVKEATKRLQNITLHDEQLIAGIALHQGKIAELKTGEGKTNAATLPMFLNSLEGRGCHLVTPNDYLSTHGAGWMGNIYHLLGASTGVIVHDKAYLYNPDELNPDFLDEYAKKLQPVDRKKAYKADITYGTNNEFGFDYLRDNLARELSRIAQTSPSGEWGIHHFAIVDEIDFILIDEARTPLIISAPGEGSTERYQQFSQLAKKLVRDTDYETDEKRKTATLTEIGLRKVERWMGKTNIYEEDFEAVRHLEQALKAQVLFHKDKDYIVKDRQVIIVDEFTGRLMPGRRFSEGLHQALEAKEAVPIQRESRTMATISFQNYFRMYTKLAGMTGTASTESEEFHKIYGLEVVVVPPHRKVIRDDASDLVYKTESAKYRAVAKEVEKRHESGQPVLVGTVSVEKSQLLHNYLKRKQIPHQILNAKNHEKEALIIAQAGQVGAVTIATNMAGRGVDIILGGEPYNEESYQKVINNGGLHVIGTERHESRRIDNQLRGRSGRQGDVGSSRFYVSLQDDLMRIFGGAAVEKIMDRLGLDENVPIEAGLVSKSISQAQKRVEGHNFDNRKHVVEYDDVLNKQRETVYQLRRKVLEYAVETKDTNEFKNWLGEKLENILENFDQLWDKFVDKVGEGDWKKVVLQVCLHTLDSLWVNHLTTLADLRQGVGLRGYSGRDPLVEYKREGRLLFQKLISTVWATIGDRLSKLQFLQTTTPKQQQQVARNLQYKHKESELGVEDEAKTMQKTKVGRNDPCPCGSGKKYKKCCGKNI